MAFGKFIQGLAGNFSEENKETLIKEYGNFLREHHLMELDTNFTDQIATMIYVDKEEKEKIKAALVEFFNGKVTLTDQGLREVEVPVNLV